MFFVSGLFLFCFCFRFFCVNCVCASFSKLCEALCFSIFLCLFFPYLFLFRILFGLDFSRFFCLFCFGLFLSVCVVCFSFLGCEILSADLERLLFYALFSPAHLFLNSESCCCHFEIISFVKHSITSQFVPVIFLVTFVHFVVCLFLFHLATPMPCFVFGLCNNVQL